MRLTLSILFLCCANTFGQSLINPYAFGSGYTANTAVFDGSNDYMNLASAGPTGLADGKVFTFSSWVKLTANSAFHSVFDVSSNPIGGALRVLIRVNDDGTVLVFAVNSAGTEILRITTTQTILVASGWVHLYVCMDLTDTAKRKIYFNGSPCTLTVTTYSNDTIDLIGADHNYRVGARVASASDKLNGALAELWWNDSYLDDTTLFASGGKPISLGADGSTPTGSQPVFYLKGSGDGFNVNSGTGGNFTITGSLGTTTPP
jgi:hypothetical protein